MDRETLVRLYQKTDSKGFVFPDTKSWSNGHVLLSGIEGLESFLSFRLEKKPGACYRIELMGDTFVAFERLKEGNPLFTTPKDGYAPARLVHFKDVPVPKTVGKEEKDGVLWKFALRTEMSPEETWLDRDYYNFLRDAGATKFYIDPFEQNGKPILAKDKSGEWRGIVTPTPMKHPVPEYLFKP